MLVFFSWVAFAWFVVGTGIIVWTLHRAFQFRYVRATSPAVNDDASAVRSFLGMLNQAQQSLIIYDDGDDAEGSLYNDRRVVEAVQRKLKGNPVFKVRCLFNCDDNLLFQREFKKERQVHVRIRSNGPSDDGIHYKIIDGGAKAYLSRHALGSKERRYTIIDCTRVPPRHRGHVADSLLGMYKEDFEQAFEASAAVN